MKANCLHKYGKYSWMWIIGLILLAGGCSEPKMMPATGTPLDAFYVRTPTLFLQLSPTPSPTAIATTALTQALTIASRPSSPVTQMPIPTRTPVLTLPPEEVKAVLMDLYANNGGCYFPCWWGITPGETSWEQVQESLAPLTVDSYTNTKGGITLYEFVFVIPEGMDLPTARGREGDFYSYYFNPSIFVQSETVLAIDLSAGWISRDFDYSLAGLLQMLGKPEEIWLRLITDVPPEYGPEYEIRLFYPDKGILLSSGGRAAWQQNKLRICPQEHWTDIFPPGIMLWPPNLDVAFQDINTSLLGGMRNLHLDKHVLLEDLAKDFNSTDFYETYLNPKTTMCFEVTP